MSAFTFIKGRFLLLFLVAVVLHILLALFAPDPNGYVWDFYSKAIILTYENGALPASDACWVCYHPPLLSLLGAGVFNLVAFVSDSRDVQLFVFAMLLNAASLIFSIYCFAIYLRYRKYAELDLTLWGLILYLPVSFIASFSVESDMLVAVFIVISIYYFSLFLKDAINQNLHLTAVFIALAALTKYTGLIIALLFGFILLFRYLCHRDGSRLKQGLIYSLIVVVIGGFPYITNLIDTGSPVIGNKAWQNNRGYYTYNFKDFSIPRIIDVFTDPRDAKLKYYYQYNSEVLNSHYGQLWTDMSIFTRAYRHGQYELKFIYKNKYMPIVLLWAILITGLIPVISGVVGFGMLFSQREHYFLISIFLLSAGLYMHWFMGHNWWMMKTKYLLYLLPIWLISISQIGRLINPVIFRIFLIPCVFFSIIYCFFFAVF